MRISDWSSDVCSSDLTRLRFAPVRDGDFAGLLAYMDEAHFLAFGVERVAGERRIVARRRVVAAESERGEMLASQPLGEGAVSLRLKIGRASCRERVCPYVSISVVAVSLQKKRTNQ